MKSSYIAKLIDEEYKRNKNYKEKEFKRKKCKEKNCEYCEFFKICKNK